MPLTDTSIRNAKPAAKAVKLFDGAGLYVEVAPAGGKWWRLKYRFDGKEKRLSLGVYPEVSLKDARERRDTACKLLASGVDPGANRKALHSARQDRVANSFEVVAREWHTKYASTWDARHAGTILRRFERDIFPWIGARPIADVSAPDLLSVLRRIEERGALETAHRALGSCGQVFRYAVATGRAERDPSGDLRGVLPPVAGEHFAAVTEPAQAGALLRTLDGYQGTFAAGRQSYILRLDWKQVARPIRDRSLFSIFGMVLRRYVEPDANREKSESREIEPSYNANYAGTVSRSHRKLVGLCLHRSVTRVRGAFLFRGQTDFAAQSWGS